MGSFTGTPFTVNLGQNCGCGSDCPGCCGQVCGDCSGIAGALHLTYTTDIANCTNTVAVLTWNPSTSRWEGSGETFVCGTFCDASGDAVAFRLKCTGIGVNRFTLSHTCDNWSHSTDFVSTAFTCSPISISFGGITNGFCTICTSVSFSGTVTG